MQCDIECFECFCHVCATKSISKAADHVHISQSALSQKLKKMESCLGCELFTRSNLGVELTETGSVMLKYAEHIIKNYKLMLEKLSHIDKYYNTVKMEACMPIDAYTLPNVLYQIKKKYPHHNYELNSNYSQTIRQNVLNGICDIGFVCEKPKDHDLLSFKMETEKLVLTTSVHSKMPKKIHVKDLLGYPLIMINHFNMSEKLDSMLKNDGYCIQDLDVLFNLGSIESIKSILLKSYGVSFLPYSSIKEELRTKQLRLIDVLDFNVDYDMYLINKTEGCINHSVREFINSFKEISFKHFQFNIEKEAG